MKTQRRKRPQPDAEIAVTLDPTTTIFSSDLLTPEEERELLATFWEMKTELVKLMIRHFPKLRAHRPAMEPWPMAQFIRDYCDVEQRTKAELRRVYDRYIHCKHRLASANIRLATYATWWIRQTLQIAVARQSHLVSLSPHHLQELGLLQQESEALAHGGKHLPSAQELAKRTGSSLEHLTHLQTATRTPVSLNAVLDDDSDFKLTEAMPDNNSNVLRISAERQEALSFLMENLRP